MTRRAVSGEARLGLNRGIPMGVATHGMCTDDRDIADLRGSTGLDFVEPANELARDPTGERSIVGLGGYNSGHLITKHKMKQLRHTLHRGVQITGALHVSSQSERKKNTVHWFGIY